MPRKKFDDYVFCNLYLGKVAICSLPSRLVPTWLYSDHGGGTREFFTANVDRHGQAKFRLQKRHTCPHAWMHLHLSLVIAPSNCKSPIWLFTMSNTPYSTTLMLWRYSTKYIFSALSFICHFLSFPFGSHTYENDSCKGKPWKQKTRKLKFKGI